MQDFTHWTVIGRGDERTCYLNPEDPTRCIKVSCKEKAKQSKREIRYFQYLLKRDVAFTHIPKFYRVVETKDYIGIEQERIIDSFGKQPLDLFHYLHKPLSSEQQRLFWNAMDSLKAYLIEYNIIPCDMMMSNMLVVECDSGIKIMMIDGLGGAEWLPLSDYIPCLGKKKINRKWREFVERVLTPHFERLQAL